MGQASVYGAVTKCPRCGGSLRYRAEMDARDCQGECGTRWHDRDLFAAKLRPSNYSPYEPVVLADEMRTTYPANPFDIDESDDRGEYIAHMLATIETSVRRLPVLGPTERAFIESVSQQFDDRGSLTDKQFSWLQDIYTRKTA